MRLKTFTLPAFVKTVPCECEWHTRSAQLLVTPPLALLCSKGTGMGWIKRTAWCQVPTVIVHVVAKLENRDFEF